MKACCGSKIYRHKKGCAQAEPEPEEAEDDEVEEEPVAVAAEEEGAEQPDQQFACKECGNIRTEPYGTKATILDCPNSWADANHEKHVYELKIEE